MEGPEVRNRDFADGQDEEITREEVPIAGSVTKVRVLDNSPRRYGTYNSSRRDGAQMIGPSDLRQRNAAHQYQPRQLPRVHLEPLGCPKPGCSALRDVWGNGYQSQQENREQVYAAPIIRRCRYNFRSLVPHGFSIGL